MPKDTLLAKTNWKIYFKDMSKEGIRLSFLNNRQYYLSKDQYSATMNDNFWALAISIRDRLVERWIATQQRYHKQNLRRVYYLSIEFLIGRLLGNYMINLGIEKEVEQAMDELGFDLDVIRDQELDAGLGNGGLGRLAACFLDSMATLGVPSYGYGILFDYGIFNQKIKDGFQIELPDEWLRQGSPWTFARPEYAVRVRFFGRVEPVHSPDGKTRYQWRDTQDVLAVPYDFPIPGYKNDVVNTLRLWSARSTEEFDFEYFKNGDYEKAVHQKIFSENISKVLYPNDDISSGRELRLKQEYFLVAATIGDIMRRFFTDNKEILTFPEQVAVHLNDTHPSLAIPELMRVLLDEHGLDWDVAWDIVSRTFAYTNHTLMPEALECWSVELLGRLLPRHLQIIYEINAKFLEGVSTRFPGDVERLRKMSIIQEGNPKKVQMANLSIIGSHSVNGVSELHSELLKKRFFHEFDDFFPGKFNSKTNGITPRRWLLKANTGLSQLITRHIGDKWVTDLKQLEKLSPLKDKMPFREKWREVKDKNKRILAEHIRKTTAISVDPNSIFDIQVKRIHEYKRQLLFTFYIVSQYLRLKNDPKSFLYPRTFLIGGKAAPGYFMAKHIIKFINSVADFINHDRSVRDKIRLIFLENYRVSLAEKIFPASDVSEQISLAGTEASGTGNMKFMLNGALTIGTLDGANIEMANELGEENIFIFGLKADEVDTVRRQGYNPQEYIGRSALLRDVVNLITNNCFSPYNPGLFGPLAQMITRHDPFLLCADFDSYCEAQDRVARAYADREAWTRKSITNVARAGNFSSDETIRRYAQEIWGIPLDKPKR